MRRPRLLPLTLVSLLTLVAGAGAPRGQGVLSVAGAYGADGVDKQISLLRSSEDFRVRTQAALALGASKSERAVAPLCASLGDASRTVRLASASAMGRLARGGAQCLEQRLAVEDQASVKAALQRALSQLGGGQPTIDGSTKYYVAIGTVGNASLVQDAPQVVREGFGQAARGLGGYAIAPSAETTDQARSVLSKHKALRGFYLVPQVNPPKYAGGNLTMKLTVAMLSYPDKVMLGQFTVKLTAQGVSEPDADQERELVKLAAGNAMATFSKNVDRL